MGCGSARRTLPIRSRVGRTEVVIGRSWRVLALDLLLAVLWVLNEFIDTGLGAFCIGAAAIRIRHTVPVGRSIAL